MICTFLSTYFLCHTIGFGYVQPNSFWGAVKFGSAVEEPFLGHAKFGVK
jgi:hypothetical protein